jgi:hypothetical protein
MIKAFCVFTPKTLQPGSAPQAFQQIFARDLNATTPFFLNVLRTSNE